ncbi:PilZ domain-containing protein [Vibrio sp. TH_r3]|uniref:PilZ domain-containing protein n=1 Tax=Vibrio sp. TH_r3 TaxID=3082084 RepID=UPI0029550562|nr:PilZ domain-containing protein [Vibrio sp. TH_r3]MDV7104707.1 PilZ domain-containing protein [Vibrio sp. TH_r3]
MQQSEILSLVERLIPVYGAPDFENVLAQLTEGEPASAKVIAKMELNRLMTPCTKSIDLRGRVQGECREYKLDGRTHWLDDVAINSYHKKIKRFGSYTEGVYEAMVNTRNNFRVMHQNAKTPPGPSIEDQESPFNVEAIKLGLTLNRQEQRLRMATQVDICLQSGQEICATSVDLSNSGVKLKVPSAFEYNLGEIIDANFVQILKQSHLNELNTPIKYRIIGIDECHENESIRWLRAIRISDTTIIARAIEIMLDSYSKKANHDNQDKILRARTHCYEYTYIKYTLNLPLFFSGNELKFALLNDFNKEIWDYWHDERGQASFGSLFNPSRMAELTKSGVRHSSNVVYSFIHDHQGKNLYFSLMLPEATGTERHLFWHSGARRKSWKVFRIHMFELNEEELTQFSTIASADDEQPLTHFGLLQEISDTSSIRDYLLTEKPNINSSVLNKFRHPRKIVGQPRGLYYDTISRRKAQRYQFKSPVKLGQSNQEQISGETINFSAHGLLIALSQPLEAKVNDRINVSLTELQRYDESALLTNVVYKVVRFDPKTLILHLSLEETSQTMRTINFLKKLINHNKHKLPPTNEGLPSNDLLNAMYDVLLSRLASTPVYMSKIKSVLQPVAIGVNFPLPSYVKLLQKPENRNAFSLECILKHRTARLLKDPLRPVPEAKPTYHDIYIAVLKKDNEIEAIHTKLYDEFQTLQERIRFIKKSKQLGEFFALRMTGMPAGNKSTQILMKELIELASSTTHHARALEKEFNSIIGFGELIDITEEILIRLELT